jgi:probable F420-dependent oxidoreductase
MCHQTSNFGEALSDGACNCADMKFDALLGGDLDELMSRAPALAEIGFDGVFTFEGNRDVFYPLVVAAQQTDLDLYTNVAIAFPRSPMHVAYQAYDLHRWSNGRFALGLGTQIRPHIERRYSSNWDRPLSQMREFVQATRAIFDAWQGDGSLSFSGDYYSFDLMPPIFNPGPLSSGPPPIWLGALGPKMTEMVGVEADGLLVHPFHTSLSLEELTLPRLAAGRARAPERAAPFTLGIDVIVGPCDDENAEIVRETCRANVAFYASTPAYRVTLDVHGWGELQPELRTLTREGRWAELASLVPDEILDEIAIIGTPAQVANRLVERYGGVADRVGLSVGAQVTDDALAEVLGAVRQAEAMS